MCRGIKRTINWSSNATRPIVRGRRWGIEGDGKVTWELMILFCSLLACTSFLFPHARPFYLTRYWGFSLPRVLYRASFLLAVRSAPHLSGVSDDCRLCASLLCLSSSISVPACGPPPLWWSSAFFTNLHDRLVGVSHTRVSPPLRVLPFCSIRLYHHAHTRPVPPIRGRFSQKELAFLLICVSTRFRLSHRIQLALLCPAFSFFYPRNRKTR